MKNKNILRYMIPALFIIAIVTLALYVQIIISAQQRITNADLTMQVIELQQLLKDSNNRVAELQYLNSTLSDELSVLDVAYAQALEALSTYNNDLVVDTAPPRYLDVPLDEDLQDYIWSLCCAYGIEDTYELVYAVIRRESNFNAECISSTNDYGLMQINVCNHAWLSSTLGIVDFLDPYENVHAGIYTLSSLIHRYGNLTDALMAYNMGAGGASKLWSRGVHTTTYTKGVLEAYALFKENI